MVVHSRYPIGEPRVQREARAARAAGWRVLVVCLREPGEASHETLDGIDVVRLPVRHQRGAPFATVLAEYSSFAVRAGWALARARVSWRDAIVQVHTPPDFLVFAALPARLRGARVVLDIHDLSRHMFAMRFGGVSGRLAYGLLAVIERLACAFADHVITVHEPYRREISRLGVPHEKLSVVMNVPDGSLLEQVAGNGARPAHGGPPAERPFTVAYHGTLVAHYGVDLLVEAIARLRPQVPGVRALILGDGDMLPRLQERARELGIAEVVEFSRGYLPIEDALSRVKGADCGVIPNRPSQLNRFALSSKLFEYVELGVPTVVSELETLRVYFDPRHVRFFAPGSVDALTEALLWIADNRDDADKMAERARLHATRYAWERNAERYLELLASNSRRR